MAFGIVVSRRKGLTLAVSQLLETLVWSGFYSSAEVAEMLLEDDPEDPELVLQALNAAFRRKREAEKHWPEVTDCDRLDLVFEQLHGRGIIALHNVGFTQAQGLEDVQVEFLRRGGSRGGLLGYCFYHGEDLERAVRGEGLYLFYGSLDEEDQATLALGRKLQGQLRAAGLVVEWPQNREKRIHIALQWQRRRPPYAGGR